MATSPIQRCENNFPDCLFMKLEGEPKYPKRSVLSLFSKPSPHSIELSLLINFNEQKQSFPLPGSQIWFGIRKGELRLTLENCELPYDMREIVALFDLSIPTEGQEQNGYEQQFGGEASLNSKASFTVKKSINQTQKVQFTIHQVSTKGSDDTPAWVFEVGTGKPILIGYLNSRLGTCSVKTVGQSCTINATFEVSSSDIVVRKAEGVWINFTSNQRAVFDRWLAKQFIQHKTKPYLSQATLHYV